MRKWIGASALLLAALLIFGLCAAGAEAAVPEDGLYRVGVSSSAKMFKVVGCVLHVEDGRLTAVITLSGTGYGYVFQGTPEEAEAAPREAWIPYVEDAEGKYTYAVEIPALDADVEVAGYSTKYEKWYQRTLRFFSNTLEPYAEIAADGVYSGVIASNTALDGAVCALTAADGAMELALSTEGVQAISVDGEEISVEDGSCAFVLPSLDVRIPVRVCVDDVWTDGWLKLEAAALERSAVLAEDGVYRAEVRTDSALLSFTDCVLEVSEGRMTAVLTAKNNNFAYLYPGKAKDARADEENWIAAREDKSGAFTYEIDVPALDEELPFATYSEKKKMWYDRSILIEAGTLERAD